MNMIDIPSTQFNINNFINSFRGSREILSRYHSDSEIEYYIIIKSNPDNFLGQFSNRDPHELSGFFFAKPKLVYRNEDSPTIKYAYTLRYEILIAVINDKFSIEDYFKINGLYNFRRYLDTIIEPTSHAYECIVSRELFENDQKYMPKLIGGTFSPPLNTLEKTQFENKLNKRVLSILYEFDDSIHELDGCPADEKQEFFFCDKSELFNSQAYLKQEELISVMGRITPKGKRFLYELNDDQTNNVITSSFAFVALSFSDDMKPYFESLFSHPINNRRFSPKLIADSEPEKGLDEEIFSTIDNCAFMIADLTEERPSVYVEAGYAIGKGKKVFFCAKEDHNPDFSGWKAGDPKVHFDIRNYRVTWWNPSDIKPAIYELTERINKWLETQEVKIQ